LCLQNEFLAIMEKNPKREKKERVRGEQTKKNCGRRKNVEQKDLVGIRVPQRGKGERHRGK